MKNLLHKTKCTPCSGKTPKLIEEEIFINLKKLNEWNLNDNSEMIYKKFHFKDYKKTSNFVISVMKIADNEMHHPDISFGFSYCVIMIHTHAIKGLSINDFILAAKIDLI
jgi:4a-hydroxytetrahydrobiopterin dehydratase|tara:strand:+ start:46 stop:375 length:330 start_codon:yes stop_codon:yes gene_type:complete